MNLRSKVHHGKLRAPDPPSYPIRPDPRASGDPRRPATKLAKR